MNAIDSRIERAIAVYTKETTETIPFGISDVVGLNNFAGDVYETPEAIQNEINDLEDYKTRIKANSGEFTDAASGIQELEDQIKNLQDRQDAIKKYVEQAYNEKRYRAPHAFVHPYALIKLAGASGSNALIVDNGGNSMLVDVANRRRFYEVDSSIGGYAKNPTTTTLIKWGGEDVRGRFPYSFQDFVFCKYWNKIQNNRMITLRRYPAPVTDNVEPADYEERDTTKTYDKNEKLTPPVKMNRPFSPIATAVTYFGEGTGNTLSEILSFSHKYNWEELHAEEHPIDVTSLQNDEGNVLSSEGNIGAALSTGLRMFSHAVGFLQDLRNEGTPPYYAAANYPPDPYQNGPYENRIMGPVNVIMDTYKRKRGLTFTQDGLKIKFEYVSRPISGVNNKAIMLDLLSNIMLMTYASGTWFGGMWRYRCDSPAAYPWMDGVTMNKVYQGKIFGKDGAARSLINQAWSHNGAYLTSVLGNLWDELKSAAGKLFNGMLNAFGAGKKEEDNDKNKETREVDLDVEDEKKNKAKTVAQSVSGAVQKMIARRALKGASIPYLQNQKALLTGDVVGEWHLTIGNPLNPIAVIGNLIVSNTSIKFSDELGPDDFPISFSAEIELKHALGRDRDAIESMFNRGTGRIYTLPTGYRDTYSTDGETKVDKNTGMNGEKRVKYQETSSQHWGGGLRYIMKTEERHLSNSGAGWGENMMNDYKALLPDGMKENTMASYIVSPWQIKMSL